VFSKYDNKSRFLEALVEFILILIEEPEEYVGFLNRKLISKVHPKSLEIDFPVFTSGSEMEILPVYIGNIFF
jgi:hypothetical protein